MNSAMNAQVSAMAVNSPSKDWSDYSHGIAWGTVILFAVVVAAYGAMIVAIYSQTLSLPVGTALATLLLYLAFTVFHEAGHGNIAHEVSWMKPIERVMGWSMTLPFLIMPFGLFARIHDYHHAFTNDPDRDPDHWISGGNWRTASLRVFALTMNYVYLTITRFRKDPVIAQSHKSSLIYYSFTLALAVGLIASGYALELLMIGILPAFLAQFVLGMLFDWIPHMPTRQQGRYQNTRSYLYPGLKYLTMGQNYHHIHHLYPRVPWYQYESVFNLIRPELEANNAPIEQLFSKTLPGFGQSLHAQQPSSVDGVHKLTLEVECIEQKTVDSVAITFESLNGITLPFKAGQYVTVTKRLNGESITRCYSICESPGAGKLTIGVKRVDNGRLSRYLNDSLVVGDELTVAGPFGDFIYDPAVSEASLLTLIAGGSGITPILSIAKTALEENPDIQVHLIYANSAMENVMFIYQLKVLSVVYADRFTLSYIFSQPHDAWQGARGYLDHKKLLSILAKKSSPGFGQFYICGPGVMKNVVVASLQELNVASQNIFIEEFNLAPPKPQGPVHTVTINLANGQLHQLQVAENQTVLQAASNQGINIPSACGVGQCGCCMMQVTKGESELAIDETPGLLPGEQARGLTLACQCRPKSALWLKESAS